MKEKDLYQARQTMAGFFRTRRIEMGLSQDDLSIKTGLGIATIKRFENASFWPGLKQYIVICDALDVPPFGWDIKEESK